MIKSINKIKNLGIFSNWESSQDYSFNKYNLFYGWNGSGKSTLSTLFRSIETRTFMEPFKQVEFEIERTNGVKINQSLGVELPIIKVFNNEFINENTIFESGIAKSIIYIGKENAALNDKIDNSKIVLENNQDLYNAINEEHKVKSNLKDSFFTTSGSELKAFFLNTIYAHLTIDKRTSLAIWEEIKQGQSLNDFIIDLSEFENKKLFIAQGHKKDKIEIKNLPLKCSVNDPVLYKEILELLAQNPVIKTIERLKKNPDIASWVQHGLGLHIKHQSLNCEFCNQPLPDGKLNNIEDHFNKEFQELQKELEEKIQYLKSLLIPVTSIDTKFFYSEYLIRVSKCKEEIEGYGTLINSGINEYINLLKEKRQNPLKTHFSTASIGPGNISWYNSEIETLHAIIEHHNKTVDEYNILALIKKGEIEKHFVAQKAIAENFLKLNGEIARTHQEIEDIGKILFETREEIKESEKELQNDNIPIEKINSDLHCFLGRNDITLEKNVEGGYVLRRHNDIALNLSEGEKSAIALVYFLTKISENDNDLKNTIIVFDDPISSFDSNNLFNAAHFIRDFFLNEDDTNEKVKQLFILTHNFYFFSLINEWFDKNKNVYSIKTIDKNGKREAIISDADNAIKYFGSEYHFIFFEIKKYCDAIDKSYYRTHTIANLCRQFLESFLTFKYGRKKLDKCFNEIVGFNELAKVRKFVNHYSHRANHGESIKGFNDNVFSETETLVPLVLKLIEHIDPIHYKAMTNRFNEST